MPLVQAPSAAPSKRPYAFDLNTLDFDSPRGWTCEAIWLGRKNGATRISYGEFRFWWQFREADSHDPSLSWKTLRAHCDERYGGTPWFIAGEDSSFWASPAANAPDFDLGAQIEVEECLQAMLTGLPDIPAGFEGWYHLVGS